MAYTRILQRLLDHIAALNAHGMTDGKPPTAGVADKLAVANTIALSGKAIGTPTPFDGTAPISIPVTSVTDAARLTTPRTISLTGAVTGAANFDGAANISIATTAAAGATNTGYFFADLAQLAVAAVNPNSGSSVSNIRVSRAGVSANIGNLFFLAGYGQSMEDSAAYFKWLAAGQYPGRGGFLVVGNLTITIAQPGYYLWSDSTGVQAAAITVGGTAGIFVYDCILLRTHGPSRTIVA